MGIFLPYIISEKEFFSLIFYIAYLDYLSDLSSVTFPNMTSHLDVKLLRSHELAYEINIRGVVPPDDRDERRKILRGLLSQEASNRSFSEVSDPYSFEVNVKEINDSLTTLSEDIKNFTGIYNSNEYRKIVNRLIHLTGRVRRMDTKDDVQKNERQKLLVQILSLESDFNDYFKIPATNCDEHTASSTPVHHNSQISFEKKVPVYKWGIKKFSGKEPLIPFLELIESLRISRNCSEADLFSSASDLFEKEAWTWWYTNCLKNRYSNWNQLVDGLKSTFLHSNYDSVLLDEIKSRKQAHGEPVSIFISSMEALFNRLNKGLAEPEIVNIVRNNLLPDFVRALVLHDIKTIPELSTLCKKVEDALCLNIRSSIPREKKYYPSVSEIRDTVVICWNCDKPNHKYSQCTRKKNLFCYGCGRKGVTKFSCNSCSKNEFETPTSVAVGRPSNIAGQNTTSNKNSPKRSK